MAKILIVDPNIFVQKQLHKIFSSKKNMVFSAGTGEEALDLYQRNYPDYVLLDTAIPSKDILGLVLDFIRLEKSVRIIIISEFVEKEMIGQLLKNGVKDFLLKPFNVQSLLSKINFS